MSTNFSRYLLIGLLAAGSVVLNYQAVAVGFPVGSVNITMSMPHNGSSVLVTDVSKGSLANLGDATVLAWLQSDVATYNSNVPGTLPTPVSGFNPDPQEGDPVGHFDVTGYDYAVLHYGTGPGGTSQGGGIVAIYLNGLTGFQDFPSSGLGPNGLGGLSFLRLYNDEPNRVPEGGLTAVLLGSTIVGLGAVRRFVRA